MLIFGLLSVLVAALFIIVQFDIKRLLAYSSIENMGLISFAFGLGGPIGIFAGLLHTINHSLAKTLLFCASGNILLKYKTRDMNQVRGLWRVAPVSAVLFAGGALALGGIPPFNVFVSEFSVVVAGITAGKTWLVILCLILLTIVLAGLALMLLKTVLGKQPDNVEAGEVSKVSLAAMAILLLLMFVMGIHIAEPILQLLKSAVGIEGVFEMVQKAEQNAARNQIKNIEFFQADLDQSFVEQPWSLQSFNKILLDPPRSGAAFALNALCELKAEKILYVSCNPATLVRDAEILRDFGYKIGKSAVIDMFPHTGHLESITLFTTK